MWSTECYNQLTSSYGKIILAGWRASGIFAALEDDLIGFLIDSFNKIDPFDLAIEIKMIQSFGPKKKFSMITTQTKGFAIRKIWISTNYNLN